MAGDGVALTYSDFCPIIGRKLMNAVYTRIHGVGFFRSAQETGSG